MFFVYVYINFFYKNIEIYYAICKVFLSLDFLIKMVNKDNCKKL